MDWLDLLAVQGTLKSLLQHHSSKASVLRGSAFFIVQFSHPYMTTGKTIVLTRWTFVGKVMSLLFNMLSRLIIIFLPRSKHLLISWLQSPSAVILLLGNALCSQKNMCTVAPVEKESSYCSRSHWDVFSSTFRCFVMKNFSPLFVKIMSFCPFCRVLCRYRLSKCGLSLHCFHIVSSLKGLELMH